MTASVLLLLTLRVAGIVVLVAVASLLRRRAAASERHWLWMIALGGVLVLPLATAILPAWRVVPLSAGVSEQRSVAAPALASDTRIIAATPADREPTVGPAAAVPVERAIARTVSAGNVDLRNVDLTRVALAIWLAGTLVYFVRLFRAHARARAIVRASRPWISAKCDGREFAIRQSDLATAPFTYGVFRPTIIVPADAVEWPAARVDAVVKHEAAHASRDDGVALLLAEVTCAIYWWHPAVRYAGRQAAVECERACDDVVLETGMLASDYGTQLLAQAQAGSAWGTRPLATIMFGRSEGLAARIGALLDPRVDRRPLRRSRALASAVLGVGTVALLAAAAPLEQSVITPAPATLPTVPPTPELVPSAPLPRAQATSPATPRVPLPVVTVRVPVLPVVRVGASERPATACIQADPHQARTARFDSLAFTGAGSFNTTSLGNESAWSGVPQRYGTVLVWTGIDCIAWIRYADPIVVDRTWPGIKVQPGGEFAIHDESGATRRDYWVDARGTSTLAVNGQAVAMTPSDVTWLADMVREYVRRRGVGAIARADSIVVNGGAQALLAEVGQIGQGQVRVTYLLTGFAKVPAEGRAAFIHDGAALLDHASARGQFLLAVPSEWKSDERVLSAMFAEAALIEPDDIVEQLLRQTPPPRPLSPALRPLIERLIATLQRVDRRQALSAYYLDVRP